MAQSVSCYFAFVWICILSFYLSLKEEKFAVFHIGFFCSKRLGSWLILVAQFLKYRFLRFFLFVNWELVKMLRISYFLFFVLIPIVFNEMSTCIAVLLPGFLVYFKNSILMLHNKYCLLNNILKKMFRKPFNLGQTCRIF